VVGFRHLGAELRRRKVFRTAGLYLIGAWIVLQVANVTLGPLGVPDWVNTLLIWVAIIGFPVTVVLGWRYELGPDGLVLTRPRTGADDDTDLSLQRADYLILTLVVIVVSAAAYGLVARFSATTGDAGRRGAILQNTIAVLPFINMSTDPDDAPIGDGLSDDLRDQLSLVPAVGVVARGSSIVFRDQEADVRRVSADLGAAFLVTGRVTSTVISVELIEGPTGIRVWSKPFERRAQGIFAIQQEIVAQVVAQIAPGVEMAPATSNVSAHERLLLARQLDWEVRDNLDVDVHKLDRALELYREAIELDPSSALAHSRLGALLLYAGDVDAAVVEVDRALALDSRLSEAHYTQALYLMRRKFPGIEAAYQRAVDLGPSNAEALAAYAQWVWGNADAASAGDLFRRALDLDPLSLVRFQDYGEYLASMNRRDEVLELAERIRGRFPDARGLLALARLHELIGEVDVAIAWGLKALELQPAEDTSWYVAELYAQIGDFEAARLYEPAPGVGQLFLQERYSELIELAENLILEQGQGERVFYALGFAYSAEGDFLAAVDLLERVGEFAPESLSPADAEARMTLLGAKKARGDTTIRTAIETAVADHQRQFDTGMRNAWLPTILRGCAYALFDRDAEALDALERLDGSLGLPQLPLLEDYQCFQHLQDEPRYRAVVANVKRRQAELRLRLPETLRAHGLERAQVGAQD
jgi:TolB-like protein/tetratricopeptide (TPR) repeat protein